MNRALLLSIFVMACGGNDKPAENASLGCTPTRRAIAAAAAAVVTEWGQKSSGTERPVPVNRDTVSGSKKAWKARWSVLVSASAPM